MTVIDPDRWHALEPLLDEVLDLAGRLAEARRAKVRLEQIIAVYPRIRNTDDQVPDGQVLAGWLALAEGDAAKAKAAFLGALNANGYFEGKRRKRLRPVVLLAAESALSLGEIDEALRLAALRFGAGADHPRTRQAEALTAAVER